MSASAAKALPTFLVGLAALRVAAQEPFPPATPESQGMSSAALAELVSIIDDYHARDMVVGAEFLVIKNRRTVLHEVFGWKDRESAEPMHPGTIFNVRSMTKPFTGAAAQMLIDEGLLDLSDTAAGFLPGFDNDASREITVEQLLTHRSGLPTGILTSVDEYPDLWSMGNAVGEIGPDFPPGSKFWYSDAGSDALGAIVEQIAGTGLQSFVTSRLLEPLQMNESFSCSPGDGHPLWDRVASLYFPYSGVWTRFWKPDGTPFYPFAWGSQTLYATPMDYAHFLAMWMDNGQWDGAQVLAPDAVQRQLTPVSVMTNMGADTPAPTGFYDTRVWYGQLAVLYLPLEATAGDEPSVIGHSGSDGTWAWAWPEHDLIILYCTQSRGGLTGIRLEMEIDRLIVRPGYKTTVPMEYRRYVGDYLANYGDYHNEVFGVFVHNGRLTVDIPDVLFFELKDPDSRGRWFFLLNPNRYVLFQNDADGNVSTMKLYDSGAVRTLPRITPPENDSLGLY